MFLTLTFPTAAYLLALLWHGTQPGLDDWLPAILAGGSLVIFIGFAVYNVLKRKHLSLPNEQTEEKK